MVSSNSAKSFLENMDEKQWDEYRQSMLGIYEFCFGVSFKRHDEPTE
jgi:hypothetical protein